MGFLGRMVFGEEHLQEANGFRIGDVIRANGEQGDLTIKKIVRQRNGTVLVYSEPANAAESTPETVIPVDRAIKA